MSHATNHRSAGICTRSRGVVMSEVILRRGRRFPTRMINHRIAVCWEFECPEVRQRSKPPTAKPMLATSIEEYTAASLPACAVL